MCGLTRTKGGKFRVGRKGKATTKKKAMKQLAAIHIRKKKLAPRRKR